MSPVTRSHGSLAVLAASLIYAGPVLGQVTSPGGGRIGRGTSDHYPGQSDAVRPHYGGYFDPGGLYGYGTYEPYYGFSPYLYDTPYLNTTPTYSRGYFNVYGAAARSPNARSTASAHITVTLPADARLWFDD